MSTEDPELREKWNRFVEQVETHRLALFRYCLKLTSNPFDAEDLVSETLMKTFVSKAFTDNNLESTLAFLARVASRLWIDEHRRNKRHATDVVVEPEVTAGNLAAEVQDAADALHDQLTPEQRAVVVLKEVFDMSHKEISTLLSISEEKSRVVLHRSKSELWATKHHAPRASRKLVQQFVDAFLDHDVDGVKALLLDQVETTVFPLGREIAPKDELLWLEVSFSHTPSDLQIHDVLGDLAVLVFRTDDQEVEALEEVWLLEESGGAISRIIDYGVAPTLVAWIAEFCNRTPRDPRFRFVFDEGGGDSG